MDRHAHQCCCERALSPALVRIVRGSAGCRPGICSKNGQTRDLGTGVIDCERHDGVVTLISARLMTQICPAHGSAGVREAVVAAEAGASARLSRWAANQAIDAFRVGTRILGARPGRWLVSAEGRRLQATSGQERVLLAFISLLQNADPVAGYLAASVRVAGQDDVDAALLGWADGIIVPLDGSVDIASPPAWQVTPSTAAAVARRVDAQFGGVADPERVRVDLESILIRMLEVTPAHYMVVADARARATGDPWMLRIDLAWTSAGQLTAEPTDEASRLGLRERELLAHFAGDLEAAAIVAWSSGDVGFSPRAWLVARRRELRGTRWEVDETDLLVRVAEVIEARAELERWRG